VRVALEQVDGKWPNLALAKLTAWHREQGDAVDWYSPLEGADLVYASQVFLESEPSPYLPPDTVWGGSGHDLATRLSAEVEATRPDWSLWPAWDKDVGYSTRGCVRHCPFCIVREKEGDLCVVAEFGDLWNGRDTLVLLDANATAAPIEHFRALCDAATHEGVTLDFSQGLDARLLTDEHAAILARSRMSRTIHMAFDHPRDETAVRRATRMMQDAGVNTRGRLLFFVLIGFDTTPEEDLYRVELLRDIGANPFVMRYGSERYQVDFARWANRPQLFRACTFAEYQRGLATPRADGQMDTDAEDTPKPS
jgi:hypothetical protein